MDSPELQTPEPGNAGYDLPACYGAVVKAGEYARIGTGLAFALPDGYAGLILGRSGNAFKLGLFAPHIGLLDQNYRGELYVMLYNSGDNDLVIQPGDKIAQMLVVPYFSSRVQEVTELPESNRGEAGFGSSGLGAALRAELIKV